MKENYDWEMFTPPEWSDKDWSRRSLINAIDGAFELGYMVGVAETLKNLKDKENSSNKSVKEK